MASFTYVLAAPYCTQIVFVRCWYTPYASGPNVKTARAALLSFATPIPGLRFEYARHQRPQGAYDGTREPVG